MSEAQQAAAMAEPPTVDDSNLMATSAVSQDTAAVKDSQEQQDTSMRMDFYMSLNPQARKQMDDAAVDLYESFMQDDNAILTYGQSAVETLNRVIDHLLTSEDRMGLLKGDQTAGVDQLLSNAKHELDGIMTKYGNSTDIGKKPNKFLEWIKGKKRKLDDFKFQRKSIMDKLAEIDGTVVAKAEKLKNNSFGIKELQDENANAIHGMIGLIASLEAVHKYAIDKSRETQAQLDKIDMNSPDWQEVHTKLSHIADVVNLIEQQHSTYMARLANAYITNSRVTNIVRSQQQLIANIQLVHTQTIPIMKDMLAQIGSILGMKDSYNAVNTIKHTTSDLMTMNNKMATETLPAITKMAQSPIISADDIKKATQAQEESNKKIVEAIQQGAKARRDLEDAVIESSQKIKESDELRDKNLLNALLNDRQQREELLNSIANRASKSYDGPQSNN